MDEAADLPAPPRSLDDFHRIVQRVVLDKQDACTGLLPASTAVTVHGNYTDAWVRDNVYSILCVWALALAYKKCQHETVESGVRAFELEMSVVKLMRGLLRSMMRQAPKVEVFKHTQATKDALHAKYDTKTGETVVADNEWGHLQVDATSIFVLFLAQMTLSGLRIVYTQDEVAFVQNLVFYIERAYRTPDFGIWERGHKCNLGTPELNTSSVGMAVAALRAVRGVNLFGAMGGSHSVIHVLPDELSRNENTLEALAPRESNSKEVDAALLSVIGFPAFSLRRRELVDSTHADIISKLEGKYGCKRFLRDGHQTVLEDTSRLHYEPHELSVFDHIECEWPLFFTYMFVNALFAGDAARAADYKKRIEGIMVPQSLGGVCVGLVPEVYYVPEELVEKEKNEPHSQPRLPNDNIPLVWAQSLYLLGAMVHEGLVTREELDAVGLHQRQFLHPKHTVIQLALLVEDEETQQELAVYGLETQTVREVRPLRLCPSSGLIRLYEQLGRNAKLGLTGRPPRPMGVLSTCSIYRVGRELLLFTPHFMDENVFYLTADHSLFVDILRDELLFLSRNWKSVGRPTLPVVFHKGLLADVRKRGDRSEVVSFLIALRNGLHSDLAVRMARVQELLPTSNITVVDFGVPPAIASFDKFSPADALLSTRLEHGARRRKGVVTGSYLRTCRLPLSPTYANRLKVAAQPSRTQSSPGKKRVEGAACLPAGAASAPTLEQPKLSKEQREELEAALVASTSLDEQAGLLSTLAAHLGMDATVRAGQVRTLVEEAYLKALYLEEWSVARQCAGLLRKTVGSLSICITDMVLRQKIVTICASPDPRFCIDVPISPSHIVQLLHDAWFSQDPRFVSLMQELLLHLGLFIRTDQSMFEGIVNISLESIMLCMRQELINEYGVNGEDALEVLFGLSPLEVKSTLRRLLTMRRQIVQKAPAPVRVDGQVTNTRLLRSLSSRSMSTDDAIARPPRLSLAVQSAGYEHGDFSKFCVSDSIRFNMDTRGMNVVLVSRTTGEVMDAASFDTHASHDESRRFADYLNMQGPQVVCMVSAKDEASKCLTEDAFIACEDFGSSLIRDLGWRQSWCMIGSRVMDAAVEELNTSGPTNEITYTFLPRTISKLPAAAATHPAEECAADPVEAVQMWAHLRCVNGGLCRRPPLFHAQAWHVLNGSEGIKFSEANTLQREPTVLENTPYERNFVLKVEACLRSSQSPTTRQLVVECLAAVYGLLYPQWSTPPASMPGSPVRAALACVDLPALITRAAALFQQQFGPASVAGGADAAEDDTMGGFLDLPEEGELGARGFFEAAARELLKVE